MIQSLRAIRTAAILFLAGVAPVSAQAQIAQDGAPIDVPAPATIVLLGAAAGAAMLVKAYRNRR